MKNKNKVCKSLGKTFPGRVQWKTVYVMLIETLTCCGIKGSDADSGLQVKKITWDVTDGQKY